MRVLILKFKPASLPFAQLVELLTSAADLGVRALEVQFTQAQCENLDSILTQTLADELPDLAILCCPRELDSFRPAFSKIKQRIGHDLPLLIAFEEDQPSKIWELLQDGATDFVTLPCRPGDILPRLWQLNQNGENQKPLIQHLRERCGFRHFVGNSPALLEQLEKLPTIARSDINVLILGETGTGKEICARAIHNLSPRVKRPFIPINCGAVPVDLVENELFGHASGAYTGASDTQRGLIEEATGGSLFLDEVECLQLCAQAKLLRFLQEREFKPLGDSKIRRADVRIIAASNADLSQAVAAGQFRRDLYYRLNVVSISMPPLRNRSGDIPILAQHFLEKQAREFAKVVKGLTDAAIQKLVFYDWPGNIRELENIIKGAVLLTKGPLLREGDIKLPVNETSSTKFSFKERKAEVIAAFESAYLSEKLRACAGNITQAAKASKQHPRAFRRLIRKYQLKISA